MAACCSNTVTPKMIKSGRVSVGDRIQMEEEMPVSKNPAPEEGKATVPSEETHSSDDVMVSAAAATDADNHSNAYMRAASGEYIKSATAESGRMNYDPLPYSQMTSYLSNVSMGGTPDAPSMITPPDPMTPSGYDEEIDYDALQSMNGFLRTQIGRYMKIEQLVGSNTIQDRYGFLVGVGSNFILLQEITTGNIMVLDIFSIRLSYIYYSQPVFPNL